LSYSALDYDNFCAVAGAFAALPVVDVNM